MGLRIGIPTEIKPREGRVALVPEAAGELVRNGHEVYLQTDAGAASGYVDSLYQAQGVQILADAAALYARAELVVKVKEPIDPEIALLRADHRLFCFLHLAANRALQTRLQQIGVTALAFETVADQGGLPILTPMSDIAGRIAIQVGAHLLHATQGGKGLLLGGVASAERGHVVVLGAGQAGGAAARAAAALGARVTVFDHAPTRLLAMHALGANVTALPATAAALDAAVIAADLVVGAVLLPGATAPRLISRAQVARMARGSVIVDIAVDQGGCIETTRATTYDVPTFVDEGVVHFCVTNMPGAVPRSASQALSAAMLPYLQRLALPDWHDDAVLRAAVNVAQGQVVHPALL